MELDHVHIYPGLSGGYVFCGTTVALNDFEVINFDSSLVTGICVFFLIKSYKKGELKIFIRLEKCGKILIRIS